jgi:hypothetical protein
MEIRWKIPPFAVSRGAPPKAAPNSTELATIRRLDATE